MIQKLRIGDAGRILDSIHLLSAPELCRELTIDTKGAYALGRNRKRLEGPVTDAREQFTKERQKILDDSKASGASNDEIKAAIMKIDTDLADIEIDVDLFPIYIHQINGRSNGALVDIFARLDGTILFDDAPAQVPLAMKVADAEPVAASN